jgi:oxygen-independent coproporphyrinogen-3 oxidase
MEANPGTVDRVSLREYQRLGINRLSFGVQTFHNDELAFLTRIHTAASAKEAVMFSREAGFENVSLDLIFALPQQTLSRWHENLVEAVALKPDHISAYSLIVEKGTPLITMVESKQVTPASQELEAEMYVLTMNFLAAEGFDHYEVSNYALPGKRSVHNCNYWNHTNYLSFGPSAHSFWDKHRWWNVRSIEGYCKTVNDGALPLAGEEFLADTQLLDEAVMLGLRSDGIDLEQLSSRFGKDMRTSLRRLIRELVKGGFTLLDDAKLRLTAKGFLVCDSISERILHALVKNDTGSPHP